MKEMLVTGAVRIPWPTTIDGDRIPSDRSEPLLCKDCKNRECQTKPFAPMGTKCHLGLTYYSTPIAGHRIVVYGVLTPAERTDLPKHPRIKEDLKGRSVAVEQFQSWSSCLQKLAAAIEQTTKTQTSRALHPFHDARNLAEDILKLTGKLLDSLPGLNISDRFEAADENSKALVKAAELLVDSYDLAAIYVTPESATYGKKRKTEIYKLIDKLRMILSLPIENRPTRRIRIDGRCYAAVDLYDSFKLLPLTLLDNAIKYSTKTDVTVRIAETQSAIKVEVESTGPEILDEEVQTIFEYGVRGRHAVQMDKKGTGLGLYAASVVAKANGVKLRATSRPLAYAVNGVMQATNTFAFEIARH